MEDTGEKIGIRGLLLSFDLNLDQVIRDKMMRTLTLCMRDKAVLIMAHMELGDTSREDILLTDGEASETHVLLFRDKVEMEEGEG